MAGNVARIRSKSTNARDERTPPQLMENSHATMLEDIEHAGSALDRAQLFLEDFQRSKIEIMPSVCGSLYA